MRLCGIIPLLTISCGSSDAPITHIDLNEKTVTIPGVVYPKRYNTRNDRAHGHHLIVWSKGGNANKALFETHVPDLEILDALEEIGAESGNNLTQKTWSERNNPQSIEPDMQVEGTSIDITINWNGAEHPIYEILNDVTPDEIDIRVGGHAELAPIGNSGSIVCLFSCPGGRTSNAAFTIRDQSIGRREFTANLSILPPDGTSVEIRMRIVE